MVSQMVERRLFESDLKPSLFKSKCLVKEGSQQVSLSVARRNAVSILATGSVL